jgi:hypothetical protein
MRARVAEVRVPFALPVGPDDLRDAGNIDRLVVQAGGELAVALEA